MKFELGKLKPAAGAVKKAKRLGAGTSSGHGKTCGRGTKGEKARSNGPRPGFEGGQMPLVRKLPKRGFRRVPSQEWEIVNTMSLNRFKENSEVGPGELRKEGLVKGGSVKILGKGALKKPLVVKANAFSKHARKVIEEAGGKAIRVQVS